MFEMPNLKWFTANIIGSLIVVAIFALYIFFSNSKSLQSSSHLYNYSVYLALYCFISWFILGLVFFLIASTKDEKIEENKSVKVQLLDMTPSFIMFAVMLLCQILFKKMFPYPTQHSIF